MAKKIKVKKNETAVATPPSVSSAELRKKAKGQ